MPKTATWIGPYGFRLANGTVLETGITQLEIGVEIGEDEANDSDHWRVDKEPSGSAHKGKGDA